MSSLSDLLPAGGGGKNVNFVASGVLPNGRAVALKSNGQVEAVAETAIPEDLSNTAVTFTSTPVYQCLVAYDPNTANKIVVAYADNGNSGYPTAAVGTVSGTTISFGSAVVAKSATTQQLAISFDPSNSGKFVFVYGYGGNLDGASIVGTVSGTSISFGSEVVFNAGTSDFNSVAFDPNNAGKFVVVYQDGSNGSKGTSRAGTVSGTSISYGNEIVFDEYNSSYTSVAFDPNTAGQCVVVYKDANNSNYGTARVGRVNAASYISWEYEYVFNSGTTNYTSLSFDPKNATKFVVVYQDASNSQYGTARVGTISGVSLSYGAEVVFQTARCNHIKVAFDPSQANTFAVVYTDEGNNFAPTVIVGTVSGTSISFGSQVALVSSNCRMNEISFDPNTAGKFVSNYRDDGNSGRGTSNVGQVAASATNLTSTNFLGITDAAVASGASGSVTIKGGLKTELAGGTFAVTVANPGAGNRYYINGVLQQTLNLREGFTYKFDQSASSNSGHPFRFSITSNGTHAGGSEYTTGVTTSGTPGNAGAYTQIVVAASAPTLYYYCTNHSLMGGQANTIAAIVANSIYYVQADGSISTVSTSPAVRIGRAFSPTSINLEFS